MLHNITQDDTYLIVYRPVVLITHPGHDQNGSLCQNDINTEPCTVVLRIYCLELLTNNKYTNLRSSAYTYLVLIYAQHYYNSC